MLDIEPRQINRCWFYKLETPVFLALGRFGDLCILLPGFKAIHDRMGVKPIVMVSKEFANIFDGVSYVQPHPVIFDCHRQVRDAIRFAWQVYGDRVIIPKWWDDPSLTPPTELPHLWFPDSRQPESAPLNGTVRLTANGSSWVMKKEDWQNYMTSAWEHAGFSRRQMLDWPLVFDRRDPVAEDALRKQIFRTAKPKLLFNLGGATNPVPAQYRPQVMACIQSFANKFEVINVGQIRARRLFDLLGLFDSAVGLITADTSTLHLSRASKVPTIGLVANGGGASVTFGNCILRVHYNEIPQRISEITKSISSFCAC